MHDGSDDADANDDLKNPRIALNSFLKKTWILFLKFNIKKLRVKPPQKTME